MRANSKTFAAASLAAMSALAMPAALWAQQAEPPAQATITVEAERPPLGVELPKGPDIKGIITARKGDRMRVTAVDGTSTVIILTEETKVKGGGGVFGGKNKPTTASLINGLPVTVKTSQWSGGLVASQVNFKGGDLKTATMIRQGTAQGFAEQTAATEGLRSRMADIDSYNIKGSTNVYFETGKWNLTPQAKNELCTAATQAEGTNNALILVVGYTDSVGSEEYNQVLSEKRAASVINHLQQYCRWKPYRMLTPTGMAESDPAADNNTPEGKAQNRRVSVNILVSKSVDGF